MSSKAAKDNIHSITSDKVASNQIHSTAILSDQVIMGKNVKVGPYSVLEGRVSLGDNVVIHAHAHIYHGTTIGNNSTVFPFAVIGGEPQDLKYRGEESTVTIGNNTVIREHATIHKGTRGGRMVTSVGDNCLIMAASHIAHDCEIGEGVIIAHNAVIGGHVWIGHNAIIGGLAAIHQHVRIGQHAIIGGGSVVIRDVIPYGNVYGQRSNLNGINIIGMKRGNVHAENIDKALKLYQKLFRSEGKRHSQLFRERLREIENDDLGEIGREIVDFLNAESQRSICMDRNEPNLPEEI